MIRPMPRARSAATPPMFVNYQMRRLIHANILEPQWSTVLPVEPLLAVGKAARRAALAFRAVWAVEERDVLIADVTEPVDFGFVFEKAERDAVYGCVAPALVEETTGAVEVVEVITVDLTAPEAQVADLEIGP